MFFSADFFPLWKKKCIFVVKALQQLTKIPNLRTRKKLLFAAIYLELTVIGSSVFYEADTYASPKPLTWGVCCA